MKRQNGFIGWLFGVMLGLLCPCVLASGAFSPPSGAIGDKDFNKGKAVYSGRLVSQGCVECHEQFDRSRLLDLQQSVSAFVMDCTKHKPCYEDLSSDLQKALDAYLERRYHL